MCLNCMSIDLVLGDTFLPAAHRCQDTQDQRVQIFATVRHNTDDHLLPRVLLSPDRVPVRPGFRACQAHVFDILDQRVER